MLNHVILIGKLTRSPELRKTPSGTSVININIACETGFKDKKKIDYINCVAWDKQADFVSKYLTKGSLVSVIGRIQSRSWEDSNGKKHYVQEVLINTIKGLEGKSTSVINDDSYYEIDIDDEVDDHSELNITSDDLPF